MGLYLAKCSPAASKTHIFDLNDVELLHVMKFLSPKDLYSFSRVCKRFAILFRIKVRSNRSLININRHLTASLLNMSMIKMYKSRITPYVEISIDYRKLLNTLILHMQHIESLWLDGCIDINDNNVYLVGDYLPNLRNLWLFNLNVSDRGLETLFKFSPRLRRLALKSLDVHGKCFQTINSELISLSILLCWGPDNEGQRIITNKLSESLQELIIVNKGFQGDNVANNVIDKFSKIETLILRVRINPATVLRLRQLPNLRHLQLFLDEIRPREVAFFHTMNNIKSLHLEFGSASDQSLAQVLLRFPNVEVLNIRSETRPESTTEQIDAICNLQLLKKLTITTFRIFENGEQFSRLANCEQLHSVKIGYVHRECVHQIVSAFTRSANQIRKKAVEMKIDPHY
ncbi:hypothetical protein B4U79_18687 [Dinothrombium tinctorium]|uniref:F-box domain-containing protein n=1 Tax=Dinothrombium tinctorium TaxID=1965070 RepID=A0A443QB95_9ACAR|nr:hypothetical protein B4U79_18687 [Dinothrombium tinctorium]